MKKTKLNLMYVILALMIFHTITFGSISILNHTPSKNALNISPSSIITIQFSANMNVSTLTNSNIRIFGELSGLHASTFSYNSSNYTVTLNPTAVFKLGENIEVIVTERVKSISNDSLIKPYVWRFSIDVLQGFSSYVLDTSISAYNLNGAILFDADNDGDLDGAYNSHDNGTVTIVKNNGVGGFSTFTTLTGGGLAYTTYHPSCGDFNADGYLDLAIPVRYSNIASIWFNTGTGNFSPAQQVGVDYEPEQIAVADFNGDGYPDLVVTCNNATNFYYDILINDRTGHFTRTQQVHVSNRPDICTTADFNGDGAIDIGASVSPSSSSNCFILLNNGFGDFTVTPISVPNTSYTPTPGDVDGDGDVDIIVNGNSSSANYGMKVLKNNGTGTFSAGQSFGNQNQVYGQKLMKDMNNDAYLDVVAGWGADFEIYFNDGSGNFTPGYTVHGNNGWTGYCLGIGDVDGNGNLDIGRVDGNYFSVFKAVLPTIPIPPTLVSPPNGSINQPTTIRFIWNRSQYATSYRFQAAIDSLFSNIIVNDSTLADSTILVANLLNNTTYWWRVNAKNSAGTSQYSAVWHFKTILAAPSPPILISPLNGATGQSLTPTLTWSSVPGAVSYKAQVSNDSLFSSTLLDSAGITITQVVVPAGRLLNDHRYYWRVNATNAAGTSPWSVVFHFNTVLAGINPYGSEIPKEYRLYTNYPNPFNPVTQIRFDIPKASFTKLTIYDILGREVATLVNEKLSPGTYEVEWSATGGGTNYPSGVYFYKLETNEYRETRKLVLLK